MAHRTDPSSPAKTPYYTSTTTSIIVSHRLHWWEAQSSIDINSIDTIVIVINNGTATLLETKTSNIPSYLRSHPTSTTDTTTHTSYCVIISEL